MARYLRRILRREGPEAEVVGLFAESSLGLAAMDFFTVPTVTFRVLYCFFVMQHERRKILHCNVTHHPTAEWTVQRLREAFPDPAAIVTSSSIETESSMRR